MTEPRIVERSRLIAAPVERILPHVSDLHAWRDWSPWEGLDPDLQRDYSGPQSGVGATYSWSGNRQAGAGTMCITDVTPASVDVDVQFTKPFRSTSLSRFRFAQSDGGTLTTWSMVMPQGFRMRLAAAFIKLDKMLGDDIEKGLAGLAAVVE